VPLERSRTRRLVGDSDSDLAVMTYTTTPAAIHHQARRISNLPDSSARRLLLWIYLCWIMLSLVDAVPILSVGGITALEKRVSFEVPGLHLSIFMFLRFP